MPGDFVEEAAAAGKNLFWQRTFASLRARNYRVFLVGQALNQTGTWMQRLAQAWLVLELTNSGTWLGITVALQGLPTLLLGPWAGLTADRHSKRAILIAIGVIGCVPSTLLGILTFTGHIGMEGVLVLALVTGFFDAFEKPARLAFPSEMVGADLLTNAVTLNNVIQEAGKSVGPAVAALLIASAGLPFTFFANAVSYLAATAALVLLRPGELNSGRAIRRDRGQLRDGLRTVRRDPRLFAPLCLLAVAGLFAYNLQVLVPLLGRQTFSGDAQLVGWLLASLGLGSVIGGFVLAGVLSPTLHRIIAAALGLAVCLGLAAASPTPAVAMVGLFLVGVASVVFKTLAGSWLQLTADPAMRGRVVSLLVMALVGTTPIGAPLVGLIASSFGVRIAFLAAAAGTAVAALATRAYVRQYLRAEPDLSTADLGGRGAMNPTCAECLGGGNADQLRND
jgi:MFS family permease